MNNTQLVEQSIQFTFAGDKYKDGETSRIYKNVSPDATAQALVSVGNAISGLQKDDGLIAATLIQRSAIDLVSE